MIWIIFIPFLVFAGIIENNIAKIYKQTYPTIKIEKIIIHNYKNQKITSIDTSMINPKKESGNIKVNNFYIFYKIKAKLKVLKSTQTITKNEQLNNTNTILEYITFKNFYSYPLTHYSNKVAKMYIPKRKIIYEYMVTTPNIINIGKTITIISKSGGIEVTFQAKALQNGKVGDTIKVKKDNQIFFVKIDKNGNGRL